MDEHCFEFNVFKTIVDPFSPTDLMYKFIWKSQSCLLTPLLAGIEIRCCQSIHPLVHESTFASRAYSTCDDQTCYTLHFSYEVYQQSIASRPKPIFDAPLTLSFVEVYTDTVASFGVFLHLLVMCSLFIFYAAVV